MMTSEVVGWRTLTLRQDLLGTAPFYIDFLQKCQKYPALVTEPSLKRLVYRYESLWLPLLAEWPGVDLEPPLDVKWIWHIHMLHPREYVDYCVIRYKKVVPHKIRRSESEEKFAIDRTRLIWQDKYRNESFELDLSSIHGGTYQLQNTNLICIITAAAKVMKFTHQVSLPQYRDSNFLFQALNRYKRFLFLKRQRPNTKIALPVDILLMWKVHALFPVDYYNEALRTCGLFSLCTETDHEGRSRLPDGYNDSDWSAIYLDPLVVPGSAYRGAPAYNSMRMLRTNDAWEPVVDQCDITIDEISVSELWSRDKSLVIVVRLLGNTSFTSKEVLRIETQVNKVTRAALRTQGLVSFKFDIKDNRAVEFDIYAIRSRCGCGRSEIHLNTMQFNPREPFENASFTTRDFLYQVPKVSRIDPKVSFRCLLRAAAPDPHVFSLNREPFAPIQKVPADLLSFVQSLPKWKSVIEGVTPQDSEGTHFTRARHELKSRDGSMDFHVDIIKQHDLDLGAVLIYHGDNQLVSLAHSVGDETLASSNQLTGACPLSLDAEEDELAMLINTHQGEWAVCKGRWRSNNGESGVKISVFILQDHMDLIFDIRDDEMQTITFGDVTIDMPTGRITVDSRTSALAENVALAFCVGIIYVTCQMRATLLATSRRNSVSNLAGYTAANGSVRSVKSSSDIGADLENSMNSSYKTTSRFTARRRNRKMNRRRKMSASYTYLLATGLLIDLTLHGSTKSTQQTTHTSLASIHQLYNQSQDGATENTISDARNNNYPNPAGTYNYSPNGYPTPIGVQNYSSNGYIMHSKAISHPVHVPNDVIKSPHFRNDTQVTSFNTNDDGPEYMDVRL